MVATLLAVQAALGVWASQPLAGAEDVNICGTVAVARQMTAPPATEPRTFPVGRHRTVTTQVRHPLTLHPERDHLTRCFRDPLHESCEDICAVACNSTYTSLYVTRQFADPTCCEDANPARSAQMNSSAVARAGHNQGQQGAAQAIHGPASRRDWGQGRLQHGPAAHHRTGERPSMSWPRCWDVRVGAKLCRGTGSVQLM